VGADYSSALVRQHIGTRRDATERTRVLPLSSGVAAAGSTLAAATTEHAFEPEHLSLWTGKA
jgi:hypothetical protein